MTYKKIVITAALLFSTTSVTALSIDFQPNNTELPQQNTHIGNLTINLDETNNEPQTIQNIDHQFPFTINKDPSPETTIEPGQTENISLEAENHKIPANYTREIQVVTNEQTISQEISLEVLSISQFDIEPQNISKNVSTGDTQELTKLNFTEKGNKNHEIRTNTTDEISGLLDLPASFFAFNGETKPINLTSDIPDQAQPGIYNGNITFKSSTTADEENIPVELNISDQDPPKFENTNINDVQATLDNLITVNVTDNNEVANVSATFSEILDDGSAEEISNTTFEFNNESKLYEHKFQNTSEVRSIQVDIEAEDVSGNTETMQESFDIVKLDSTRIVNENFRMEAIRDLEETEEMLIRNFEDASFRVKLTGFSYSGNESLDIGIRDSDEPNPRFFSEVGEVLEFDGTSEYYAVVESNAEEEVADLYDYRADFEIQVPEQHEDSITGDVDESAWGYLGETTFSGQINADELPDPVENVAIGDFRGSVGYQGVIDMFEDEHGEIADSEDTVYMIGSIPGDNCLGEDDWGSCSEMAAGEFDRVENLNEELRSNADSARLHRNVTVLLAALLLVGYVRMKNLTGLHNARVPVKR